jgi:putative serine protease PepD
VAPVTFDSVDADEGPEEDGPFYAWLPPDDRLWRHPSELGERLRERASAHAAIVRSPAARTWSLVALAGVVGAVVASTVGIATGDFDQHTTVIQPVTKVVAPDAASLTGISPQTNWPNIVDVLSPSVVAIRVSSTAGTSTGSGVLYAAAGRRAYIITDGSLVSQAGTIQATFTGGEMERGHLVGVDATSGLALLWVANGSFTFPVLGTVASVEVAEPVMAVGARPGGDGGVPVAGSLGGVDQTVNTGNAGQIGNLLAITGGPLPSGDAGGALVDGRGAVIGVDTSITSDDPSQTGLTFAVPMDVASHVADQMIYDQHLTHPWVGVTATTDLDSTTARGMGLAGGAQVLQVAPGSPASLADLQQNDVITGFDGQQVTSAGSLTALLNRCTIGRDARLTYLHKGKLVTEVIKIREAPSAAS